MDSYEKMREAMKREQSEETPELIAAKNEYPIESWVYLKETGQYGVVDGHEPSGDGILIRVSQIGLVPITEIRKPAKEEIQDYLNKK